MPYSSNIPVASLAAVAAIWLIYTLIGKQKRSKTPKLSENNIEAENISKVESHQVEQYTTSESIVKVSSGLASELEDSNLIEPEEILELNSLQKQPIIVKNKTNSVDLVSEPIIVKENIFLSELKKPIRFAEERDIEYNWEKVCDISEPEIMSVTPENVANEVGNLYIVDTEKHVATISRTGSPSGSEGAQTPESAYEKVNFTNIPEGFFDDPENDIEELKPDICDGKLIPRVLIPSDIWAEALDNNIWRETILIPAQMGGILIGRFGKNVRELKSLWQAEISLNLCTDRQDTLLLNITCPLENKESVLNWLNRRFQMRPSRTTIGNPNQLKRYLPLGVSTKVHIRSMYGLKDLFVSIRDADYDRFLDMQTEMNKDYSINSNFRMQLCAPITSGTVAVLPHDQGFARALILKVLSNSKYALYFLLDYGTFGIVEVSELRKIRAKYMNTRFQAIHVTWAHAWPIFSDVPDLHVLRSYFNSGQVQAHAVRMETCCKSSVVFTDRSIANVPTSTSSLDNQVDILALACREGLYMVNPLLIYPSQQIWLNGTDVAYHTPACRDIDYSSLVNYATESGLITNNYVDQQHIAQQTGYRRRPSGGGGGGFRGAQRSNQQRRYRQSHQADMNNSNNNSSKSINSKTNGLNGNGSANYQGGKRQSQQFVRRRGGGRNLSGNHNNLPAAQNNKDNFVFSGYDNRVPFTQRQAQGQAVNGERHGKQQQQSHQQSLESESNTVESATSTMPKNKTVKPASQNNKNLSKSSTSSTPKEQSESIPKQKLAPKKPEVLRS